MIKVRNHSPVIVDMPVLRLDLNYTALVSLVQGRLHDAHKLSQTSKHLSSIISLDSPSPAICPHPASRNCIVNAVVKNRQVTKARDERLGKSRKHKTRAEILAAMDLQVLPTTSNYVHKKQYKKD